ncbi:MAG: SAVED domain-containing protein [Myxococcota bacterium]|nr:SAVED domain-containing protein [Myxococcota bacterium]
MSGHLHPAEAARLVDLARHGNRGLALERLGDRDSSLFIEIHGLPPPPPGSYAVVLEQDRSVAWLERVEVVDGSANQEGGPRFVRAVNEARERAWAVVGGNGLPPPAHIRLPLSGCASVDGPSIGLPAFIAFVAHFSQMPFVEPVVATGWFNQPLGFAELKHDAWERERRRLRSSHMLVAGSHPLTARGEIRHLQRAEDIAPHVWPFIPWVADRFGDVPATRIQVRRNDDDPLPAGWTDLQIGWIEAPGCLWDKAKAVRDAVTGAITTSGRVEMRIAGPLVLAAAVGYLTKNLGPVLFVHGHGDGRRFWWNGAQPSMRDAGLSPRGVPAERRLVVRCGASYDCPDEWEPVDLGENVAPTDLPNAISKVLDMSRGRTRVHVALTGPLPLAFALGATLAPRRNATFWQWNRQERKYERWFSTDEPPWHGPRQHPTTVVRT